MNDPYQICADLYGVCRCEEEGALPCNSMVDLAENGEDAESDMLRMERERAEAEQEIGY